MSIASLLYIMMNNNHDVNYLHSLQEQLHFVTHLQRKSTQFWGKCYIVHLLYQELLT